MTTTSIRIRSLTIGVLSLVAILCFFPGNSKADTLTIVSQTSTDVFVLDSTTGITYDVTSLYTSFDGSSALMESSPWWGNGQSAGAWATALGGSLGGYPNWGFGPFFAWSTGSDTVGDFTFETVNTEYALCNDPLEEFCGGPEKYPYHVDYEFDYAVGSIVTTPEPGSLGMIFAGLVVLGLLVGMTHRRGDHLTAAAWRPNPEFHWRPTASSVERILQCAAKCYPAAHPSYKI